MNWHRVRLLLDTLEDRNVPGNALSILSMSIPFAPPLLISTSRPSNAQFATSQTTGNSVQGELLQGSRSDNSMLSSCANYTSADRSKTIQSGELISGNLNITFDALSHPEIPEGKSNFKPPFDSENLNQSTTCNASQTIDLAILQTLFSVSQYEVDHSANVLASFLMQRERE